MVLDLSEEETDALARLLRRTIEDDRYPLSPRIQIFEGQFSKDPPRASPQTLAAVEALRGATGWRTAPELTTYAHVLML